METQKNQDNLVLNRSFELAIQIVSIADALNDSRQYDLSRQILRCGTSVGANIREAQHPESRKDFYHKLKIAMKEAEETAYWLDLLEATKKISIPEELKENLLSVRKLLLRILSTTKTNM